MPTQIRAYEHIGGATGQRMRYRAQRFHVRDLFDGPFPVAMIAGAPHILSDLSSTGLAAIAQRLDEPSPDSGTEVPFAIQFGDSVLHAGDAAIARIEETGLGRKLGLQCRRNAIDIDQVVARYRQERSRARLRKGFSPHNVEAPAAFRLLCADVLDSLRTCHDALDESRYGTIDDQESLIAECIDVLEPLLGKLALEANRMIGAVLEDPAALSALKRTAEHLLTPEFALAPTWSRAYSKPLGYPGDFQLRRGLHTPEPALADPYARMLERIARRVFGWIPSRTKLIVDVLARELAAYRGSEPARVLAVAAGEAEEFRALFARSRPARPLTLTLVDQDEVALADAYTALYPQTLLNGTAVTLSCLNASHDQLFEGGELEGTLTGQNAILVPTLLDYLRHRSASQFLEALYGRLAPGGVILAGCLRNYDGSARWASELICDWSMIHRTKDEVFALAANLPRVRSDIRLDKNGDIYLLVLRKPRTESGIVAETP